MDDAAAKELGECVRKLELAQALVLEGLKTLTLRSDTVLLEMKAHNGRIDNHEIRLVVREAAWKEQIAPALERLRNLELKVAASAFGGGAIIILLTEAIKALAKGG